MLRVALDRLDAWSAHACAVGFLEQLAGDHWRDCRAELRSAHLPAQCTHQARRAGPDGLRRGDPDIAARGGVPRELPQRSAAAIIGVGGKSVPGIDPRDGSPGQVPANAELQVTITVFNESKEIIGPVRVEVVDPMRGTFADRDACTFAP